MKKLKELNNYLDRLGSSKRFYGLTIGKVMDENGEVESQHLKYRDVAQVKSFINFYYDENLNLKTDNKSRKHRLFAVKGYDGIHYNKADLEKIEPKEKEVRPASKVVSKKQEKKVNKVIVTMCRS